MNTITKTKRFVILYYNIAVAFFLVGVALNVSGSVDVGTLLIMLSIAIAGSTALKLGHLKKW